VEYYTYKFRCAVQKGKSLKKPHRALFWLNCL